MSGTPHGNAHWATIDSLKENGFQINPKPSSSGFIFGKWVTASPGEAHPMHCALYEGKHYISNNRSPQFVCFRDDIPSGHILTVAPTRSGKGVGLVIPNLLNYDQNVIVIDPKGENYSITKAYRTGEMEQEFWCFDPFKLKYKNLHGFPVLKKAKSLFDIYNTTPEEGSGLLAEISRIAESIVIRKKDEKDPFFNNAAQIMIKDVILLTLYEFEKSKTPPLSYIRSYFVDGKNLDDLSDELEQKIAVSETPNERDILVDRALRELKSYMGNRDVVATVIMQTEFLEDKNIANIVDGTNCIRNFNPECLNDSKKHSVYLIIPPQHLNRQSRFLRLFITLCMDTITRRNCEYNNLDEYNNVLFILDEIAQLGNLDCIQKAVSLATGYKMTLWMFWQDLAQLKGLYPEDWMSFLSNAKIQQFFGCNDIETAKYISERCGPRTQYSYSANNQFTTRGFHTDITTGETTSKIAGELIRPSEILRADNSIIFHFCQGCFPFICEKIKFYKDSPFSERKEN